MRLSRLRAASCEAFKNEPFFTHHVLVTLVAGKVEHILIVPSNVPPRSLGRMSHHFCVTLVLVPSPQTCSLQHHSAFDYDCERELVEHSCNIENDSVLVKLLTNLHATHNKE